MRRLSFFLFLPLAVLAALVFVAAQAPTRPAGSNANAEAIRLNNLGVATMNQQKFEPALKYFEQAAAADSSFGVAKVNQAVALVNLQRFDEARALLDAAVQSDPSNARAHYNLGLLQKSTGDAEASLSAFQKVTSLKPRDAYAHYFVGLMAAQQQQYEPAIDAFQKALALDPFLVSAEFGLARAFQRAGRQDEARAHLDRFQRLTTEKVASAMSLSYGDQGPLSLAEAVLPANAPPAPGVPVTFEADTSVVLGPQGGAKASGPLALGAGGCFFDADGDGLVDYVSLAPGATPSVSLFQAAKGGSFTAAADSGFAVQGDPVGCVAADYDNDEKPDVAITAGAGVRLFHNEGSARFKDVTDAAGLAAGGNARAIGPTFIDFDHDGDLDLVVPRTSRGALAADAPPGASTPVGGGTLVFRNNGNGTFVDVAEERGLRGAGSDIAFVGSDFNNDRAVDLVVSGGAPRILANPREGVFQALAWPSPGPTASEGVAILDLDKDGWMDVAFAHPAAPGVSLWRNGEGKAVEPVSLPSLGLEHAWGLAPVDFDNDGWVDLVVTGDAGGKGRLIVLRNDQGQLADASAAVGADKIALNAPRAVLAADVDGDGDADLTITRAGAPPLLLRNKGGNANRSLRLTLAGLADNRSGVGTKVEVQAGAIWQKFETISAGGFLGQSAPGLLVGIGKADKADVVRLLWPTGVVQDEVDVAAGAPVRIEQVDRRGSSCPLVFTWNGSGYEFITDAVGPAVIGHWIAPGQTNIADPDEYIRIEGTRLVPKDGKLSIKFAEPLEEANYLDQVRLIAVDHPVHASIYPNEYFAALAPAPEAKIFGVRNARPPAGAWDEKGRDITALVSSRDRRYVDTFADIPFRGFAALHAVELDPGTLPALGPVRLIMTGITDYFTATSMFAAHQAGVEAVVPWLEAQTADGTWRRVRDDIGFPAGLYRTMTADLTGALPAGTRRLRIWTNLKVYWDEILIDTTPDGSVPLRTTTAPLVNAALSFHGFPQDTAGTIAADLRYSYDRVSRYGPWSRHLGFYTRYGEVRPLLDQVDDRFVVFGAGEEVSLEFDGAALPPVPAGWTRDYLFYAHGYVKDMDFYGAYAQTVAPLPFGAMKTYPYASDLRYPRANSEYLLEWNTREVSSEAWPSYRLEFRGKE
jgi:Flp pilus assembly protein TadD